jgi:hypothetical protein
MLPNPNCLSCPHLLIISSTFLSNRSCAGVTIVLGRGVEEEAFCGRGCSGDPCPLLNVYTFKNGIFLFNST